MGKKNKKGKGGGGGKPGDGDAPPAPGESGQVPQPQAPGGSGYVREPPTQAVPQPMAQAVPPGFPPLEAATGRGQPAGPWGGRGAKTMPQGRGPGPAPVGEPSPQSPAAPGLHAGGGPPGMDFPPVEGFGGQGRGGRGAGGRGRGEGGQGRGEGGRGRGEGGRGRGEGGRGRGEGGRGRGEGGRGRGEGGRGRGEGGRGRGEGGRGARVGEVSTPSPPVGMAPMEAAAVPQMQGGRGQGGRGEGRGRGRGDSRGGGRGSGFVSPHEGSPGFPAPSQPSPPSSVPIPTESLEKMQIAEKRQESVSAALQKLGDKHSGFKIPLRKSTGTQAICRFTVETNHLPLKINIKEIIHYDVDIQPDKPKKLMRPVMEAVQRLCYPNKHPAFDGRKNLYSAGTLEFGTEMSTTVTIRDAERAQDLEFKVNIKFAARINMSSLQDYMTAGQSTEMPQRQIQAVDVILRSAPALRFVPVGRSYFTPPRGGIGVDLTGGMELWFGFYQSAILGWKPFVNVDVAHKGFPKAQNCVNLMRELIPNLQPNAVLSPRDVDTLSKYIKGLKVNYEIPKIPNTKRTYKVNAVVEPANQSRFDHDGKIMTVEEYYRDFKGYKLMYPNFPLLHLGSLQKKMYMPIELCSVSPGQAIMRKLNEGQTTKMIREAATPAYRRKQKIEDALNQVGFQNDRTLLEFGISVGRQFESVQARILDSPVIKYNKDTVKPQKGVWNVSQFEKGTSLTSWAILNLDRYVREDQVDEFIKQISIATRKLGMQFAPPVKRSCDTQRDRRPESWLDFARGQQFQIVVVIVSQFPGQYAKVKQTAELKMGLLTQCVKGSTIQRLKPATTSNILLKMNSKLNGVNHVLSARPRCFAEPIMVVGADVTHPSPDAVDIPSAAAVAASIDANAFRYAIKYRLQPPRVEPIEDLQNIMKELLLVFYRTNNGVKPKKIVVFRDGVSDGQFSIVLNSELMAIRRACSSLEPDYKPKITFLVVQKRHHTRFFPGRDLPPQFVDQRNGNVPAGTIVDTNITHPTELDFYLVSHASLQGTSRPTKYHLLWDDNDFSTDELEALTYHLCHMFSRCTRSVSYPAPTYYAHLAAFRARVYMEDARINMRDLAREQSVRTLNQTFEKNWPMFFV